jgi:hypothetical protein
MTNIELLERLAGPIATVVASIAALTVTLVLGLVQARIARSQANTADAQRQIARVQLEIAYDRLKHDVFERRYEVYVAADKFIERGFTPERLDLRDPELLRLSEKLGRARFLFPPDIQDICSRIQRLVFAVDEKHFPEETSERRSELANIRSELTDRFQRHLSLEQLTRKVAVDEEYVWEWWRAWKPRS